MSTVRVEVHEAELGKLKRSPEMVSLLRRITDAIAAGTGPTMVPGTDMVAGVDRNPSGARGYVFTATAHAMRGEAKDRRLTRALEAGRQ